MDKRLFDPLGMKDTTFWPNEEQLARLAKSYTPRLDKGPGGDDDRPAHLSAYSRERGPSPAGGLFSTASDVGSSAA